MYFNDSKSLIFSFNFKKKKIFHRFLLVFYFDQFLVINILIYKNPTNNYLKQAF
jgi:hypothetical protein